MSRIRLFALVALLALMAAPPPCPAPIVYRPGEGFETKGQAAQQATPKAQLEYGIELEKKREWDNALGSYRQLLRRWPTSIHAAEAQFHIGYCQEQQREYFKAFQSYQKVIDSYQGFEKFDEVLQRQFKIGNLFLSGERMKLFGVKTFPSMDKAVEIYEKVIKNGPYSEVAQQAQMAIGYAREKQKRYDDSVAAYRALIEKYPTSQLMEEAYFNVGLAFFKAATKAEYDQGYANKAVEAFNEYLVKFPSGSKTAVARDYIVRVQTDQARGLYEVAHYYDKQKDFSSALVYYNELIARHPQSSYAKEAHARVEMLRRQVALQPPPSETKR
ncbi:MAG: tetratricopeptide repeat protein [Verrucomicrobia bacterium]|nr:tetratricopeptide repeat protein [Verrucomicrobiota bacterium]